MYAKNWYNTLITVTKTVCSSTSNIFCIFVSYSVTLVMILVVDCEVRPRKLVSSTTLQIKMHKRAKLLLKIRKTIPIWNFTLFHLFQTKDERYLWNSCSCEKTALGNSIHELTNISDFEKSPTSRARRNSNKLRIKTLIYLVGDSTSRSAVRRNPHLEVAANLIVTERVRDHSTKVDRVSDLTPRVLRTFSTDEIALFVRPSARMYLSTYWCCNIHNKFD